MEGPACSACADDRACRDHTEAEQLAFKREQCNWMISKLFETARARDQAYAERNKLVCALSKLWPSHLSRHPEDPEWDPAWRNIVCIHGPVGQLTWHIFDPELPMFAHLTERPNDWDGHTSEEKYARLAKLPGYRFPVEARIQR